VGTTQYGADGCERGTHFPGADRPRRPNRMTASRPPSRHGRGNGYARRDPKRPFGGPDAGAA
jgi:hypothetical protein